MELDQAFCDSQAEACARASCCSSTVEAVEDVNLLLERDTWSVIVHADARALGILPDLDLDGSALSAILLGIGQQVAQYAAESFGVDIHHDRLVGKNDADVLRARLVEWLHCAHGSSDDLSEIHV